MGVERREEVAEWVGEVGEEEGEEERDRRSLREIVRARGQRASEAERVG